MRFEKAYIPYGGYWSTPFCKWQGSLSSVHSVSLAAQAARKAMAVRDIPASALDSLVLMNGIVDFSTVHWNTFRRRDSQSYLVAANVNDGDFHIVSDHD